MPKIDFTKVLVDLEGEPIKAEDGKLTLERACVSALLQPAKDDDGEKKYKKYSLIKKIHGTKELVALKTEEVAAIKKAVGESGFSPLIVGQAWDMIEQEAPEPKSGE